MDALVFVCDGGVWSGWGSEGLLGEDDIEIEKDEGDDGLDAADVSWRIELDGGCHTWWIT